MTLLEGPDGLFVAEHADGTRITTAPATRESSSLPEIIVECPGFARVTHRANKQCLVQFPDGSTVVGSTNGRYTVENEGEYKLEVEPSGEVRCLLQPANSTAYCFTLDHTATGSNILAAKAKKSKVEFSVGSDGVPSVSGGSGAIPPHPAFSPRYFVVPSTGSPYQILNKAEVDAYLSEMESQADTRIVKGEGVPGFEGKTFAVMTHLQEENPAIMPYKNGSIVPNNLSLASPVNGRKRAPNGRKRFGVGVGKSLHIFPITHTEEAEAKKKTEAPKALRCRQFVILDQFDEKSRDQVCSDLARYISWRQQQQGREDDLLPVDPREISEIRAAQQLKSVWLTKTTGNILNSALLNVQGSSDHPTQRDRRQKEEDDENSARFLNGIKHDLEEAERNRDALRNHTVPMYFDSDSGREFLRSQSPDMTALAKQLAQPRVRQTQLPPSHSSTPSSLQSASIVLQPDGVDSPILLQPGGVESPDVGDIDNTSVSSASKLRPTHPTPDHARGMSTPTDVRPQNPTPFGADRPTHSPALSLVSTTFGPTSQQKIGVAGVGAADERSVSFTLPPRRPTLIVGESSPCNAEVQRGSKYHNTVCNNIYMMCSSLIGC